MKTTSEYRPIAIKTPLIESTALEKLCKRQVYLKLECCQPTSSFKIRGAENCVKKNLSKGVNHIFTASGGNAGMAAAYVGKMLNLSTTIVVPETTPKLLADRIRDEGADVQVYGKNWDEANERVLKLAEGEKNLYLHPFHDEHIWEACEKIVYEIVEDLEKPPSAIVLSVGGAGMLCGVLQGLQKLELDIPVIALETYGAKCLEEALKAGEAVNIGSVSSIAVTLSPLAVTDRVFELLQKSNLINKVITDRQALESVKRFLDDHRIMVEPACGATMTAAYYGIIEELVEDGSIKGDGPVVFIVCGGGGVTTELIEKWDKIV